MAIPDATNFLSLPGESFRNSLAKSAAFQTWVGAPGDSETAKDSIYFEGLDAPAADEFTVDELVAVRPCCGIYPTDINRKVIGVGARQTSGTLGVKFFQDTPDPSTNTPKELHQILRNTIGEFIEDMEVLADQGGNFYANDFPEVDYGRSEPDAEESQGDWQFMEFAPTFGLS